MSELPIRNDGPQGVRPASEASPAVRTRAAGDSAAFKALLENLEQRAAGLRGQKADSPDDLLGALDQARASLEDALDLKERLLEAYRADLTRAEGDGGASTR
jgi:hypothetical protein